MAGMSSTWSYGCQIGVSATVAVTTAAIRVLNATESACAARYLIPSQAIAPTTKNVTTDPITRPNSPATSAPAKGASGTNR